VTDTLDFTQLAGKHFFHRKFFMKASKKTSTRPQQSPGQMKFYHSPKNGSADMQEGVQHLHRRNKTFHMTIDITRSITTSRKRDHGLQPRTLLSSFFIVTRSRDLSECPVGVMKYRQT